MHQPVPFNSFNRLGEILRGYAISLFVRLALGVSVTILVSISYFSLLMNSENYQYFLIIMDNFSIIYFSCSFVNISTGAWVFYREFELIREIQLIQEKEFLNNLPVIQRNLLQQKVVNFGKRLKIGGILRLCLMVILLIVGFAPYILRNASIFENTMLSLAGIWGILLVFFLLAAGSRVFSGLAWMDWNSWVNAVLSAISGNPLNVPSQSLVATTTTTALSSSLPNSEKLIFFNQVKSYLNTIKIGWAVFGLGLIGVFGVFFIVPFISSIGYGIYAVNIWKLSSYLWRESTSLVSNESNELSESSESNGSYQENRGRINLSGDLSNSTDVQRYCVNCGAEIREEHKFCPNCGHPIE